jgi:CBS domain-containing protein
VARPATTLPTEAPVAAALELAAQDVLVTEADGAVRGLLDVPAARALAGRDPQAPVSLVAGRFAADAIVFADDDPTQVALRVRAGAFSAMLLVDDDGRPVGVLHRADVLAALDGRHHPGRKGHA